MGKVFSKEKRHAPHSRPSTSGSGTASSYHSCSSAEKPHPPSHGSGPYPQPTNGPYQRPPSSIDPRDQPRRQDSRPTTSSSSSSGRRPGTSASTASYNSSNRPGTAGSTNSSSKPAHYRPQTNPNFNTNTHPTNLSKPSAAQPGPTPAPGLYTLKLVCPSCDRRGTPCVMAVDYNDNAATRHGYYGPPSLSSSLSSADATPWTLSIELCGFLGMTQQKATWEVWQRVLGDGAYTLRGDAAEGRGKGNKRQKGKGRFAVVELLRGLDEKRVEWESDVKFRY